MVVRANGKSGRCVEYVRRTFEGLARIGLDDPKVTELWEGVNSRATC
jgi:cation transport protein ChaC